MPYSLPLILFGSLFSKSVIDIVFFEFFCLCKALNQVAVSYRSSQFPRSSGFSLCVTTYLQSVCAKICQLLLKLLFYNHPQIFLNQFRKHYLLGLHPKLVGCILPSMQIHLISVGNRMPDWVKSGYDEYAKRLPRECELLLREILPGQRGKNCDVVRIIKEEGDRMNAAIPANAHIVALDLAGKQWTTPDLALALERWLTIGKPIALLIGGPDGLAAAAKARAVETWCLSPLTFPHPLVRIIVAEQLYRAWSILHNHPYHR